QSGFEIGGHLARPGLIAFEVLMAGQHLAIGTDKIESLVLGRPLFLHVAEEVAAGTLGLANLVEVQCNRNAVGRQESDDILIRQRTLTESMSVASAALQRIIAGGPDQDRAFL